MADKSMPLTTSTIDKALEKLKDDGRGSLLYSEAQAIVQEIERAWQMLNVYGVTKERGRYLSNGIDVLATRFAKEARALSARIHIPELNEEVLYILGTPNFRAGPVAQFLRQRGHKIPNRAEEEQAYVIHWMLVLYERFGNDWREEGKKLLGEASAIPPAQA